MTLNAFCEHVFYQCWLVGKHMLLLLLSCVWHFIILHISPFAFSLKCTHLFVSCIYMKSGMFFLSDHHYEIGPDTMDWQACQDYCHSLHGYVAEFIQDEEAEHMHTYLINQYGKWLIYIESSLWMTCCMSTAFMLRKFISKSYIVGHGLWVGHWHGIMLQLPAIVGISFSLPQTGLIVYTFRYYYRGLDQWLPHRWGDWVAREWRLWCLGRPRTTPIRGLYHHVRQLLFI